MATAPYVTLANACAEVARRLPHLPDRIAPETLFYLHRDATTAELVSIADAIGVNVIELRRCLRVIFADLAALFAPVAP